MKTFIVSLCLLLITAGQSWSQFSPSEGGIGGGGTGISGAIGAVKQGVPNSSITAGSMPIWIRPGVLGVSGLPPPASGSLFGSGINAPNDWVDQEFGYGGSYLVSSIFSISPTGNTGAFIATRASDRSCPSYPTCSTTGIAGGIQLFARNDITQIDPNTPYSIGNPYGDHFNVWGLYLQNEFLASHGVSALNEISMFNGAGNSINTATVTTRGSGYTPAGSSQFYACVPVTNVGWIQTSGGSAVQSRLGGNSGSASITVSSGSVIAIQPCAIQISGGLAVGPGQGYNVGDIISVDPASIGGTGSGFTATVTAVGYEDPYTIFESGLTRALRLDCSIGGTQLHTGTLPGGQLPDPATLWQAQTCFNALDIVNNGAKFESGIVFDKQALATDKYTNPSALSLPGNINGYGIVWFAGPDSPAWEIYSDATSGANFRKLHFGNSLVSLIDASNNIHFQVQDDIGGQTLIGTSTGASAGDYISLIGGATGTGRVVFATSLPATGAISSFGAIVGGSGYTPTSGTTTYNSIPLTVTSGAHGIGVTANVTVTNGAVTAVALISGGTGGYDTSTVLSATTTGGTCSTCIGPTGSGFTVAVAGVTIDAGADLAISTAGTGKLRYRPSADGTSVFAVNDHANNLLLLSVDSTNSVVQAPKSFQVGSSTSLALTSGELGLAKITASGTAPGAAGMKLSVVCGTNAGTAKIVASAGTSGTTVDIKDNIGAGVTGC